MIPQNIKAVIFDMDGLLIDSEPYWQKADAKQFAQHGIKHSPKINKHVMGMKPREIIAYFKKEYGFKGTVQELLEERMSLLYKLLLEDLQLMEGAKELIEDLHKRNIAMAIATSGHEREKAQLIAERLGFFNYMHAIVVGEDVKHGKPAPDIFLLAAKKLKVDPLDCLVFEDAPNGVKAGKAAKMFVIGVNKEEEIYNRLKEAGADIVLRSLKEVL